MHQYLRAIGFSQIKTKKELRELLNTVVTGCDTLNTIETDRNSAIIEYTKQFAGPCGICLRGEVEEDKNLVLDYYYPILNPSIASTAEELSVERHVQDDL